MWSPFRVDTAPSRSFEGRSRPRVLPEAERVRCPRAEPYSPPPGGSGHLPRRYYGRCVRCCHWTGTGEWRVTPAGTASQEARPGAEPLGPASLWREPRWNADRRAHPVDAQPRRKRVRRIVTQRLSAFRLLFRHCERSEAIQSGGPDQLVNEIRSAAPRWIASSLPLLAMTGITRMRMHRGNGIVCRLSQRGRRQIPLSRGTTRMHRSCRLGRLPARFLLLLRRASARLERRRTGT